MKQITSNTWRLDSIDELRPRCKNSDKGKKKYRFHCPLCGDESKHSRRTDGAFDEDKGVGHCFCCGANFFASKWTYTPKHQPMLKKPEISLGDYPSSVMAYLKERGLKPEVMHHLGVGYAELPADTPDGKKTFLAFRFLEQGEVVNVQYKSPDKEFRFEKDCRIIPYNIDSVLGATTVYITEGMMDAAVLVQCGFESVISLPNGCGTRMACFDPYREHFRGVRIVYAGDTDEKGIEKRKEVARYFVDNDFYYVEWADGKDANDVLMAGGEEYVQFCVREQLRLMSPPGVGTVDDQKEALKELIMNGVPRFPGIRLHGFSHLVRFEPGRLMVISGYPGAGKSSFADYIMMSLAVQQGWKAAVYSPEKYPMSLHYYELGQILMGREMSAKNFTRQALERGYQFLRDNVFHISEECSSIEDIIATAKQLVRLKGIRTLLIDPFNYVDLPVLTGANDTQKITHVLRQIVNFAHNEKVLVILVAHPKKPQVEGGHKQDSKMPSLYDIAGSADFYNKCDYGLILQRQSSSEYTKLALTWIHVLKIRFRHLGQIGARAFGFDTSNGRFVGTANDNLTLQERDRTDWSYREAEQQQLEFEDLAAPEPPEDDLPF